MPTVTRLVPSSASSSARFVARDRRARPRRGRARGRLGEPQPRATSCDPGRRKRGDDHDLAQSGRSSISASRAGRSSSAAPCAASARRSSRATAWRSCATAPSATRSTRAPSARSSSIASSAAPACKDNEVILEELPTSSALPQRAAARISTRARRSRAQVADGEARPAQAPAVEEPAATSAGTTSAGSTRSARTQCSVFPMGQRVPCPVLAGGGAGISDGLDEGKSFKKRKVRAKEAAAKREARLSRPVKTADV